MATPLTRHARQFGLAYFALAALLGGAIGVFVLLVEQPAPAPPPPWSAWRPGAETRLARATEIANHVAGQYHLASGRRLVRVFVGGPNASSQPIQAVAVAKKANATTQSDFDIVNADSTMMYILCGTGTKCAIKEGKATRARAAVLRREALELALYTFSYVPDTDSVVAFFPPQKGKNPTYALFFRKDDLSSELKHPLKRTLPRDRAPLPGHITKIERRTINDLTTTRVFRFALQNTQDGARVLVLAPVVP
jgi:hypothetical protein